MGLAWIYLLLAGVFEIGWPVGLKNGWTQDGISIPWVVFSVVCMAISGALLMMAQKTIPIGTAYAIWTGIGAVGTFTVGIIFFGDFMNTMRAVSILLIIAGIIGLKLA